MLNRKSDYIVFYRRRNFTESIELSANLTALALDKGVKIGDNYYPVTNILEVPKLDRESVTIEGRWEV